MNKLILSEVNCRYLSGVHTTDGFVYITDEGATLYTDGRYLEFAEKNAKIRVKPLVSPKEVISGRVEVEYSLPYSKIEWLRQWAEIIPSKQMEEEILSKREIKTPTEIDFLKQAQAITERAFEHILSFIKEGVTDLEIAAELEYVMRRCGSQGVSFDTISVTGSDTSLPHGAPNGRRVAKGDFVTMDFGATKGGMHADMTRTVAVGCVNDEQKKVYNLVLSAQKNCLENLREGVTGKQGDALARGVIEKGGYGKYFTHSTGHSVGLEIHENPSLNSRNQRPLKEGNCVTVEPGIYLPGKFGVRIEDMVLIQKEGIYNFTSADKELIIL